LNDIARLSHLNPRLPFNSPKGYARFRRDYEGGSKKKTLISPLFKKQLRENKMTPEEYLKIAREFAKENGYDERALEFSDEGNHKLMIYDDEGRKRHFGAVLYNDYILWSKQEALGKVKKGYADEKRNAYIARARKIKGDWKKDKFSPNSLSLGITWAEGL
jgi:hypothetical protein